LVIRWGGRGEYTLGLEVGNNQRMETEPGRRLADSVALACLFLRGLTPGLTAPRGCWPRVWHELRCVAGDRPSQVAALSACNLPDVVAMLRDDIRYEAALRAVEAGSVLSVADPAYPWRWLEALGGQAPPVLWRRGDMPTAAPVSVVGSRSLPVGWSRFAGAVGRAVVAEGRCLVSGGAVGADLAAADGALASGDGAPVVEILPVGLWLAPVRPSVCQLTVCAPGADFTTGQAMERNALIYAASTHTVVVRPRFRVGGTWTGAVDALRRRLGTLLVAGPPSDRAVATLVALGGVPLASVADMPAALMVEAPRPQPSLFGGSAVREPVLAFG